jgi:TPR repeat protein
MDPQTAKRLILESERLNEDEAADWSLVEALWLPYAVNGDREAQFRLAYYYLFCSFDDEKRETRERMVELLWKAAEAGHADATYWMSTLYPRGAERDRLLFKSGELGSLEAQRDLGAFYATGDWTGPRDLARAADCIVVRRSAVIRMRSTTSVLCTCLAKAYDPTSNKVCYG